MRFAIAMGRRSARALCAPLILLFGPGVVCETSRAQDAPQTAKAATYDFHRHYQAGEVDRYKVTLLITQITQTGVSTRPITYTMTVRETVKALAPGAGMTLIMEFEQASSTLDGQTLDYMATMPRITQVLDAQGRAKVTYEGRMDASAKMMVGLLGQVGKAESAGLPQKPVQVGETWKLTSSDPTVPGSGLARLEAAESLRGFPALKVNYATDAAPPGVPPARVHTDATISVEVQSGKTLQLDTKSDAWIGPQKTSVEIHYTSIDEAMYTIHRAYKAGEVERYLLNRVLSTNAPGGVNYLVKNALRKKETVQEVAQDGTVTLRDEFEQASSIANSQETDITAKMPRITQIRSAQGQIQIKVEGGDPELTTPLLEMLLQLGKAQNEVIPPQPIRVGAHWRYTSQSASNATTSSALTLRAVESVNGSQALICDRVTDTASANPSAGSSHETATVSVDAKTGKTLKLVSRLVTLFGQTKTTEDTTYTPINDKGNAGGSGVK